MLRNLNFIAIALAIGALGGVVYGNLGKDASSDLQTLAAAQVLIAEPAANAMQVLIAEPAANTAQASAHPETDGRKPEAQGATAQSEGSATETSASYRAEPAKPAAKPRPTPRLILGIGW